MEKRLIVVELIPKVLTPVFMPVGTQGTIKGLTSSQVKEDLEIQIILGNTYHLGHRPGGDVVEALGGLHKMMNWKGNILTDSGGFQMVSLLKLAKVTEEGVTFESPHDGSNMVLTPEHSIKLQNQIGSDIMMQLDDVVHSSITGERLEEAMYRSIRWLDRCLAANTRKSEQNLFPIIQGGLDMNLRKKCVAEMTKRDVPGFAIGGLSGGESKDEFWRIVSLVSALLPQDKPKYVMGIGYAEDLVVCTALGCDMYDCVFPTRTARFGTALTFEGPVHIKNAKHKNDFGPLEKGCVCRICKEYTRDFMHRNVGSSQEVGQLISFHNLHFQKTLMLRQRQAILDGTYDKWVINFMNKRFEKEGVPQWIIDALKEADIHI